MERTKTEEYFRIRYFTVILYLYVFYGRWCDFKWEWTKTKNKIIKV